MAIIFNKTTFVWDSIDDPQTLPDPQNWVVNPVFTDATDEQRCQDLGPDYWVFETAGDPLYDIIRSMTDAEIDADATFIQEMKDLQRAAVNDLRDEKLAAGFTDANSVHWNVSPQDVLNLNGVCTLISLGAVTSDQTWRDASNVNHTLTTTDLVTLAGAMAVFVQTVYGVSWVHKANIDACTTLTAATNYDITTSWPT